MVRSGHICMCTHPELDRITLNLFKISSGLLLIPWILRAPLPVSVQWNNRVTRIPYFPVHSLKTNTMQNTHTIVQIYGICTVEVSILASFPSLSVALAQNKWQMLL